MKDIDDALKAWLYHLSQIACDLGAKYAKPIGVSDVVVDPRVSFKCQVPRCPFYGNNLMCPPATISPSEFKELLKNYCAGLLLVVNSASEGPPDDLTKAGRLEDVWEITTLARRDSPTISMPTADYAKRLRSGQELLSRIESHLESLCLAQGYQFAAGLSAGGCFLCEECVGITSGLACRHPFESRPSMEALGIDVVATARRVDVGLIFTSNSPRYWVGLLLVD